jgi:hypothetical protein
MKYFVKMKHGILDDYYRSSRTNHLHGMGQGSGASPAVWLSLAVILLTAPMALAPMSMIFIDPWHNIFDECNADAYVDDTATGVNDAYLDDPLPFEEMVKNLQDTTQTWERILHSSGGALNLKKCFWYLIS